MIFGGFSTGQLCEIMTNQYQLAMIKLTRTYKSYSCTYVSMHMPIQNKIISKNLNTKGKKYSFQHQSCRPDKSSYISWDIHTQKHVTECDSSFRCLRHWPVLLKCICFYISLLFKGGKKGITYLQILKCNIIHRVTETYSGTGEKPISKLPQSGKWPRPLFLIFFMLHINMKQQILLQIVQTAPFAPSSETNQQAHQRVWH